MLGYEMNILTVDEAVKARIPHEIEQYREYEHLIKDGELYRLKNPPENGCAAYYYTNGDSSEILLSFIQTEDSVKNVSYRLKISRAERGAGLYRPTQRRKIHRRRAARGNRVRNRTEAFCIRALSCKGISRRNAVQ